MGVITMELRKIASFQMNHNLLEPGMYISRVDGDIVTYDIRMKRPNRGDYLDNPAIHTIEHLFATYVRSNPEVEDNIVYFGPMGCRTGFYFLTRELENRRAIELTQEAFRFIAGFEGEIPGAAEHDCGNWRNHDLVGAKREAELYLPALEGYTEERLQYRQ